MRRGKRVAGGVISVRLVGRLVGRVSGRVVGWEMSRVAEQAGEEGDGGRQVMWTPEIGAVRVSAMPVSPQPTTGARPSRVAGSMRRRMPAAPSAARAGAPPNHPARQAPQHTARRMTPATWRSRAAKRLTLRAA